MASKKAVKEPTPKPLPAAPAAAAPAVEAPAAEAPKDLVIPAGSKAIVVLGIDPNGNLFNHLGGEKLGLVEVAGLLAYGQRVLDALWDRSLAPQQPAE